MEDPRLLEWLELTERALGAPEEKLGEVLHEVSLGRAELKRSLEQTPPTSPPGRELAQKLDDAEGALGRLAETLRGEIQKKIADLRKVQHATKGYRPARADDPAFVSRSI
jgi:hypothetical protein